MVRFVNITKRYGKDIVALDKVSFSVGKGEFVSLIGRSGAGKSTLMKLLIGEEKPTEGSVFFLDLEVNKLKGHQLLTLRRQIGVVFQDFRLLPDRTVSENISFALEVSGTPEKETREIVPQVLKLVGLLGKAKRFPRELSGGEKQRVAIARALVHSPDVIIADEPTGNLDPINSQEIARLLVKINDIAKTSILLASHDREIVNAIGRRVVHLDRGRIIRDEQKGKYAV